MGGVDDSLAAGVGLKVPRTVLICAKKLSMLYRPFQLEMSDNSGTVNLKRLVYMRRRTVMEKCNARCYDGFTLDQNSCVLNTVT